MMLGLRDVAMFAQQMTIYDNTLWHLHVWWDSLRVNIFYCYFTCQDIHRHLSHRKVDLSMQFNNKCIGR